MLARSVFWIPILIIRLHLLVNNFKWINRAWNPYHASQTRNKYHSGALLHPSRCATEDKSKTKWQASGSWRQRLLLLKCCSANHPQGGRHGPCEKSPVSISGQPQRQTAPHVNYHWPLLMQEDKRLFSKLVLKRETSQNRPGQCQCSNMWLYI